MMVVLEELLEPIRIGAAIGVAFVVIGIGAGIGFFILAALLNLGCGV